MPRIPSNPNAQFRPDVANMRGASARLLPEASAAFPRMKRFDALLGEPHARWYVVASGPNGKDYVKHIPKGANIIVCNSAIQYGLPAAYWVAFDHRLSFCPWWPKVKVPADCVKIFGVRLVNHLSAYPHKLRHHEPDGYFEFNPQIMPHRRTNPNNNLFPGILRGGLTVSGVALQLAAFAGAKEIILVGVDFFGIGHFDGLQAGIPTCRREWPYARAFERFARALSAKVYIGSPSVLQLPLWTWNANETNH